MNHKKKKPVKRGRRKIKIEYIKDKSKRHITFSKRKGGIMKKAYELTTLTGTQALLLIASETGHVYTFATPKLQPLITKADGKNLIQACLNAPDPIPEEEEKFVGRNFIQQQQQQQMNQMQQMGRAQQMPQMNQINQMNQMNQMSQMNQMKQMQQMGRMSGRMGISSFQNYNIPQHQQHQQHQQQHQQHQQQHQQRQHQGGKSGSGTNRITINTTRNDVF